MSHGTAAGAISLPEDIYWWHQIDLGNGIVTPGQDDSALKMQMLKLPDLKGKSVIDVGAWDGYFSFAAEQAGASRVLATDYHCWRFGGDRGFDFAHKALRSQVEKKTIRVEEISPETVGMFDVVLFLGVLYHAQNPMDYLTRVLSVCREMIIVETLIDALDVQRPAAIYYPGATENNDVSNFWGPNPACVMGMLRDVGVKKVEQVAFYYGNRGVFHAWV